MELKKSLKSFMKDFVPKALLSLIACGFLFTLSGVSIYKRHLTYDIHNLQSQKTSLLEAKNKYQHELTKSLEPTLSKGHFTHGRLKQSQVLHIIRLDQGSSSYESL